MSTMNRWGNPEGEVLFFLHANSYASKMYLPFLEPLTKEYDIWGPDLPGHGDSRWNGRIEAWVNLANYYIAYIEKNPPGRPMVAMGHSIGGIVIMLMAIQRPDWFHKIILLDPVILPKRILALMRVLRLFSLTHIIPLTRATARRRNHFETRASALEHYSKKAIFSRWEPQFLEAYVETCLRENGKGAFQLSCAPQLESSIYQSIPLNVWSLPKKLPVLALFIIGEKSDTVNQRGFKRLKRSRGNHIVKSVVAGHLFPFEKPAESMAIIKDYLAT
ncbi:MAG: alpha/beta hydrolase [Candidatus Marinimicrobia bacterium]|nr:alpha/beta hydrolase [Candidatus Neomarinimicrobiota bacterium]